MKNDENGGSYVRQKDGSLKLVARTEQPTPSEIIAATETSEAVSSTPAAPVTLEPGSKPKNQKEA